MNLEPRLKLTDTMPELLAKMTEGNPGAMTVCIALIRQGGQIDPKSRAEWPDEDHGFG